jgi:hypothetical protein
LASKLDKSFKFYLNRIRAIVIFNLKRGGVRNEMILIGKSKINLCDQPSKEEELFILWVLKPNSEKNL